MAKTIKGTAKADKLKVTESNITLTAGKGNDTITVSGGKKSTVRGQDGNDVITVTAKVGTGNKIYGDAGVDTIKIQGGNSNYYYGGTGNDIITLSGGKSNTIHGDAGDDVITVTAKAGTGNKIYGDAGVDTIKIQGGNSNYYYGGIGNDIITLSGGKSNTIHGDAGNDVITVTNGSSNIVYGDAGNDTFVVGTKGRLSIKDYTPNQDTLKISGGTVTKTALNGTNVVFTVGSANVTLEKASGKNISVKDSRGSHTVSNSTISLGSDFSGAMDSNAYLSTVKTIDGSAATKSINIIGNTQNNIIYAGKSGGTYQGKTGNDQYIINSTLADSTVFTIDQTIANQSDTDTLVVKNAKWADTYVGISNSVLTLQNKAGGRIIIKGWDTNPIKQIQFADKTVAINDITTKASSQNIIRGLDGKPVLNGTVGNDLIYGSVATKSIYADNGDDEIIVGHNQIVYAGNGNDTITSKEPGTNVLYGGTGNDRIVVSGRGKNYLYGGDGTDTLEVTPNAGSYYLYGGKEKDTYIANLSNLYSDTYTGGSIEIKNVEKAYTDEEYAALENAEANGYATYKKINSDREDTLVINNYSLDDFTFKLDKFDLVISRKYDVYATNSNVDQSELIRIKDWYVHPLESIQFADGTYTADEINEFMANTDYTWVKSGRTYTAWGDSIRDEFLISDTPHNAIIKSFSDRDVLDFRYSFTKEQVQFAQEGSNLKIVCNDTKIVTVNSFFENNVSTAFVYFKDSQNKEDLLNILKDNLNSENSYIFAEKDEIIYAGNDNNTIITHSFNNLPKAIYGKGGDDTINIVVNGSNYSSEKSIFNGGSGNDTYCIKAGDGSAQCTNLTIVIDQTTKGANDVDTLEIDYDTNSWRYEFIDKSSYILLRPKQYYVNDRPYVEYRIYGEIDKVFFKQDNRTYTKEDIANMINSKSVSSAMLTFSDNSVSSSANIGNDLFQQNNSSNIIVTGNV